ncbi:hypothetical protein QFC21_006210 [Naganishia friedmannii]|uniref:Uncharacterized protein n=1 Tax=Naganishia friedmannii TaxID=89922 RepID=A0ACC2V4C9_9TREE|nr:hypothetical protein QFC21_006210 [Naganishia friedmannii]
MDKHIINTARTIVPQSLLGLTQTQPTLQLDEEYRVVSLRDVPPRKVALISGGGSGHEPAHAGMVGKGLLSAAAAGNVFASPNVGQVRRALDLVVNEKGTLIVLMRYTGDVLLFGLAKEQHAVTHPSYPIELVMIGDDVAVPRSQGALVGRRGLAGTILAYKCAAAAAAEGREVGECRDVAQAVGAMLGTIGAGLNHCHVPGTATQDNYLKGDEVEIGMGIHNESGISKRKLPPARELITSMLSYITNTSDTERAFLPFKHDGQDRVVLMVNNLGGLSELEMGLVAHETLAVLDEQGIEVVRANVGSFMTSCNLPGFSLTLLLLPRDEDQPIFTAERILELLDAPASAPGWKPLNRVVKEKDAYVKNQAPVEAIRNGGKKVPCTINCSRALVPSFETFQSALRSACESVIQAEPEITHFDTKIIKAIEDKEMDSGDCINSVLSIAQAIGRKMDGTSGALYNIWSNALAAGFANAETADGSAWARALSHALATLYKYTAARAPSRTLIDSLSTFTEHFGVSQGKDFSGAVKAAVDAAERTRDIQATAGRAAYVGQDALKEANVPDPGAWGVVKILEGIDRVIGFSK